MNRATVNVIALAVGLLALGVALLPVSAAGEQCGLAVTAAWERPTPLPEDASRGERALAELPNLGPTDCEEAARARLVTSAVLAGLALLFLCLAPSVSTQRKEN